MTAAITSDAGFTAKAILTPLGGVSKDTPGCSHYGNGRSDQVLAPPTPNRTGQSYWPRIRLVHDIRHKAKVPLLAESTLSVKN